MMFRFALEVEAKPQIALPASTATQSVLSLNNPVQTAFCPSLPASPVSTASLHRAVGVVDGAGCAIWRFTLSLHAWFGAITGRLVPRCFLVSCLLTSLSLEATDSWILDLPWMVLVSPESQRRCC